MGVLDLSSFRASRRTFTLSLSVAAALSCVAGCRRPHTAAPDPALTAAPAAPAPPPRYPEGTTVAGIAIGGMTEPQAGNILRYSLKPLATRTVTLHGENRAFARQWADVGARANVDAMLRQAWETPRVPLAVTVSMAEAKASVRRAARAIDVAPVAPRFTGNPVDGAIRPGKAGRRVNVAGSAMRLADALAQDPGTRSVKLMVGPQAPPFSEEDLLAVQTPVTRYVTRFNPGDRNRTHNLRLVAQRLDGALVKPGQTFSFNGWVGERRPSDGFRDAIVYKQGRQVRDTAGGLCQVSSTLYNVALLAGLPVVERSNHSLTVTYVPLGRDATVYWGQHDLRFRNDTDMPLYIHATAGRNRLVVEAWGSAPLDRKVQVTSTSSRRNGRAFARVYRTMAHNGIKKRELISDDAYSTDHGAPPPPSRRTRRT